MLLLSAVQALLLLCGLVSLVLLPTHLIQNVYVDENALMPNAVTCSVQTIGYVDGVRAMQANVNRFTRTSELASLLDSFDLETHTLPVDVSRASTVAQQQWNHCQSSNQSVLSSVMRASRGDGKEAIAFVVEWTQGTTSPSIESKWPSAVAHLIALQRHLQSASWLSKDIILVVLPVQSSNCQHYSQYLLQSWFDATRNGIDGVPRLGVVSVAVALNVDAEQPFDRLNINPIGQFGSLPNMDTVSTLIDIASKWSLSPVFVQPRDDTGQHHIVSQFISSFPSILPVWMINSVKRWENQQKTMINHFMTAVTGGEPELHSVFIRNNIDAMTVQTTMSKPNSRIDSTAVLINFGCAIEAYVRAHSNLIEKLHHSLHLYLLVSATKFSSISKYAPCFLLLLIPNGLQVLYLYFVKFLLHSCSARQALVTCSLLIANLLSSFTLLALPKLLIMADIQLNQSSWLVVIISISAVTISAPNLLSGVFRTPIHWLLAKALQLCLICITSGALFVMNFPLAMCVLLAVSVTLLPIRTIRSSRLLTMLQWVYIGFVSYLFVTFLSNRISVDSWSSSINAYLNVGVSTSSLSLTALLALVVPSWLLTLQTLVYAQ